MIFKKQFKIFVNLNTVNPTIIKSVNIEISDFEFNQLGLNKNTFSFSKLIDIIGKKIILQTLQKTISLATQYGLSNMSLEEIDNDIKEHRMQKIILDTNAIISSLIQKNYPYLIVEHCIEENAIICLANAIVQEYIEVLSRPKFTKFTDFKVNADFVLARIAQISEYYEPLTKLTIIKDEQDNRFLELAYISKADFTITGNTNDFKMENYYGTKIVSPKTYWEEY